MTKINLITQGQQLINASKVVVAAGDINSVQLCVDFDSAWKEYPVRSATFYTSKNDTVQEMLLLNDQCIVPFEVLAEACVLFIGVRGITTDGEGVKTSSLVKYKISEGATAGDKTLTPTMDLYQQYLSAVKAEADPVIAAFKEEITAAAMEAIAAVEETAQLLNSDIHGTVLWENPSPTSPIGETTIEMDLSEFKTFRVIYDTKIHALTSNGNGYECYHEAHITEKGIAYGLTMPHAQDGNPYVRVRRIIFSDSGIWFAENLNVDNRTVDSYNNIPVKIIGYKH